MPAVALRIGAITWLPKLLPLIVRVDLGLARITGGRCGLLDIAGLPNLRLHVRGRRSGLERTTPLLCAPYGSGWLIAGSFFGQPSTPQWVTNLRASGTAAIEWKGRRIAVTATELHGAERGSAWQVLLQVWPNYRLYESHTTRVIPIFRLSPDVPATR
jgi:deazaflavin-dependent oxidoreductase (nitroreductase family)